MRKFLGNAVQVSAAFLFVAMIVIAVALDSEIGVLTAAAMGAGMSVVMAVYRFGKKLKTAYAEELLARDARAPILLLRTFADDEQFHLNGINHVGSLEEILTSCLSTVGPVITIGRPGEWAPPLGASRLYVSGDWREHVLRLIAECRLIVVVVGATKGLAWEVRQASAVLGKMIVVLPPVPMPEAEIRWRALVGELSHGRSLSIPPSPPPDGVYATFDSAGDCVFYESRGVRRRAKWKVSKTRYYTKPLHRILDALTGTTKAERLRAQRTFGWRVKAIWPRFVVVMGMMIIPFLAVWIAVGWFGIQLKR